MRPIAQSDGHDAPGLIDELVPGVAAVVDDVVVGFEDAVREPVVAHELPDVLDGVQFGAFRRQRQMVMLAGTTSAWTGASPPDRAGARRARRARRSAAISARCRFIASVLQAGRIKAAPLPSFRADRAEDVGRRGALIAGRAGRVPRLAQRRVILFFWPIRASSANQISILSLSSAFSRAISSRRAGKLF